MAAIVASPATPSSISRSNSAAKANSTSTERPSTVSHAGSSDLGVVPGSFPRDPHVPLDHLSDKAAAANEAGPSTDSGTIIDAVQEDIRHAVDVAASYLPESVVGAIGPVLPGGKTDTEETNSSLESGLASQAGRSSTSKRVEFNDVAIGGIVSDFTLAGRGSTINPSSTKQTTSNDDSLDTPAATPTPVPRGVPTHTASKDNDIEAGGARGSTDLRRKAVEATAVGAGIGTIGGVAYHHHQAQTPKTETPREAEYAKRVQQATAGPDTQAQTESDANGNKARATAIGGGIAAGAIDDAAYNHEQSRAPQLPTPPSSPSTTSSPAEARGAGPDDIDPAFVSYAPGPVITDDTPFLNEDDEPTEKGLSPDSSSASSATESSPTHGVTDADGSFSGKGNDAGDGRSNKAAALGFGAGAVGVGAAAALAQSRAKENNSMPTVASPEAPQIPPKAASRPSASGGTDTLASAAANGKGTEKGVTSDDDHEGVAASAGALGSAAAYQQQQATPAVRAKDAPSSGVLEPVPTPTTGVSASEPQSKAADAGPLGPNSFAPVDKKDLEKEQQKAIKGAEKYESDAKKSDKEAAAAEKKAAKQARARAKEEKRHEKELKKQHKRLSKERQWKKEQVKEEIVKKSEDGKKEDETKGIGEKVAAGTVVVGAGDGIGAGVAGKELQKEKDEPKKEKISLEQSGKPKQDDVAQQFYLPSQHRSTDAHINALSPEHPSTATASVNKDNKGVATGAVVVGAGAGIGAGIARDKLDTGEAKKVDPDQESRQLSADSNNLAVAGNVHPSIKAASPRPVRPGAVALGAAAPSQRPSSGVDSDFPLPSVNASTEDVPQTVVINGKGRTSSELGAASPQNRLDAPVAHSQSERARYHGTEGLQEKYPGGALGSSFIEKKKDEEKESVGHRRNQSRDASDRKKEGFVRHLVEKVKDKLHRHEK